MILDMIGIEIAMVTGTNKNTSQPSLKLDTSILIMEYPSLVIEVEIVMM